MTGVLWILAILSIVGGFVGWPAALGGSHPTPFQRWLDTKGLRRDKKEGPIDFAARILDVIRTDYTYHYDPDEDKAWRDAAFVLDSLTYLTAEELQSVGREIMAIIDRYGDRVTDRSKRPADANPIAIVATGHPVAPTPSGN